MLFYDYCYDFLGMDSAAATVGAAPRKTRFALASLFAPVFFFFQTMTRKTRMTISSKTQMTMTAITPPPKSDGAYDDDGISF